ncbi:MAG: glycosyltransferase family 4 protein [Phycisphaerales bacterium]|nr:glycosyltransferase family 4 protein [Phycisphaerales bacterium]
MTPISPLRITIITGPFYPTPPFPTGAVQRIWYDVGKEFAALGHSVTILACRYPGQAAEEKVDGLLVRRRTNLRQGLNTYRDIVKDFWYALNMAIMLPPGDVLVTNSFWAPVLARLRRGRAGKVVVHVATSPKGQLFLYRGVDGLDTPSDAMKSMIVQQAPWAHEIVSVSPNPIDTSVFTPPTGGRDWTKPGTRTLLYTGRVHPTKGLHLLVEAYAKLKREQAGRHLSLRLIGAKTVGEGGGGDDYLRRLSALAGDLPMIIDDPIYDRAGLAEALRAGDYYAYPSQAPGGEAFGVAPLEAMATGLVPVVSDMQGFRQFITDNVDGLIFDQNAPDAADRLAGQLRRLLTDATLTAKMSDAGIARAKQFGCREVAERHIASFRAMISSKKGTVA